MFDVAIVGGGIVGTAVAYELSRRGRSVLLVEKERALATHQTGNNSGVVHTGIYYRPGSLKARLCVQGAARMKQFCRDHGLPLKQVGKVIVATREEEIPRLDELQRRAVANGVPGVEMIGPERLREIEPHAAGLRALWIASVCITDYAAVARKLAELSGATIKTQALARPIRRDHWILGDDRARFLITCAGLQSDRLARAPGIQIVPFRGEYSMLAREDLVRGLIYPVPDPTLPFLGVHFTRRVHGGVEAGPNAVLALKREGYRWRDVDLFDLTRLIGFTGFWRMARQRARIGVEEVYRSFVKAKLVRDLQKLVPEIRSEDLRPGGSGVRAMAVDLQGTLIDEFRLIEGPDAIHVVNAPSPAATASLAIAEHVVSRGFGTPAPAHRRS